MADEQLTEQGIFDTVARHLLTQNEKCLNPSGIGCSYGTWKGPKCAVGCLFTEAEFAPGEIVEIFENTGTWLHITNTAKRLIPPRLKGHEYLLGNLQVIHDHRRVEDWKAALRDLARNYGLSSRVIEEFNNADS